MPMRQPEWSEEPAEVFWAHFGRRPPTKRGRPQTSTPAPSTRRNRAAKAKGKQVKKQRLAAEREERGSIMGSPLSESSSSSAFSCEVTPNPHNHSPSSSSSAGSEMSSRSSSSSLSSAGSGCVYLDAFGRQRILNDYSGPWHDYMCGHSLDRGRVAFARHCTKVLPPSEEAAANQRAEEHVEQELRQRRGVAAAAIAAAGAISHLRDLGSQLRAALLREQAKVEAASAETQRLEAALQAAQQTAQVAGANRALLAQAQAYISNLKQQLERLRQISGRARHNAIALRQYAAATCK